MCSGRAFCCSRKYPNSPPPPQRVFWFEPPTPLEIPVYTFLIKILAFKTPTSSEFQMTLCGGVWIFSGTTHFNRMISLTEVG